MSTPELPVGVIKTEPKDFVVKEGSFTPIFETRLWGAKSPFTAFILTKSGITADRAYAEISRQLGVRLSAISDYGMKDAVAVTVQKIVVEGPFTPTFVHDRMWLTQIGPAEGPLRSGRHNGNHFSILVRTDLVERPTPDTRFRNLFGPQRFGDGRVHVGRLLLESKYDEAFDMLVGGQNWSLLHRIYKDGYTKEEALFHSDFRYNLGFKVLQWQSYLWNKLALTTDETSLPMWSSENAWSVYGHLWEPPVEIDEEIACLCHTFTRPVWVFAQEYRHQKDKFGWRHHFMLRPGSYATVFLSTVYTLVDASTARHETATAAK